MMVVVNQTASNYSPKVVETLATHRSNQYILGVYIGSIIFSLIIMMHIDSRKVDGGIPQIGLLVNMLLAVYSVFLFVRFINNISESVRITGIVETLFKKTKKGLLKEHKEHFADREIFSQTEWHAVSANHSGYFQLIRTRPLVEILRQHDAIIKVLPKAGEHYTKTCNLFLINRRLPEETLDKVRSHFITYAGENILENPMYGFRQLREVAVKALSPGINDPGVAELCIHHLTELLQIHLERKKGNVLVDDEQKPRIVLNMYSLEDLLHLTFLPIKNYAKQDFTVLCTLLDSIQMINGTDKSQTYTHLLHSQAISIIEDANVNIHNNLERDRINQLIKKLRANGFPNLPFIETQPINGRKQ